MEETKILLVEDNIEDARIVTHLLKDYPQANFTMKHVERINDAIDCLLDDDFDLLILDLFLPDASGFDTIRRISNVASHVPIIVLTGLEDNALAFEAVQFGVQDYFVKGQVNGSILSRSILHAIERKKTENQLQFLATHDMLTKLPNRSLFQDRLNHSLDLLKRTNNHGSENFAKLAVMMMDIDHFKDINDSLGHEQGDKLLQAVARRLLKIVRQCDTIARFGGDEFVLLFENISTMEEVDLLGERVLSVFSTPFLLAGCEFSISTSVGISVYPDDGENYQSLLHTADLALYYAKRERNRYCVFSAVEEGEL
jgi:diguanylate cyclase (GGDEF)-like protein